MIRYLLLAFVVSVPISVINFSGFLMGGMPTPRQTFASILFIFLWFIYAVFMGNKKRTNFFLFASSYWIIGASFFAIGYMVSPNFAGIFILAALLFAGPLYGLRTILELPSDIYFVMISMGIIYGASLLGYVIGRYTRR
jgi:hypothetical protein